MRYLTTILASAVMAAIVGCSGHSWAADESPPASETPVSAVGSSPSGSSTALGAAQSVGDAALQEVVVTARKRSENVQHVPISIAAVTATRLTQQNVTTITGLDTIVSGLEIRQSPNNTPALTLRGLGTGTGSMAFDQSVGAFVDGAYLGHGRLFNNAFFDLDRVEVIKGTQASLLGKNTSLGAISMVTRDPGDTYSYDFSETYEAELGSNRIAAGLDLPLAPTLSMRVAGQVDHEAGWVHDVITNTNGPDVDNYGARMTLVWKPSPNFTGKFMYQGAWSHRTGDSIETINDWSTIAGGYPPFNVPGIFSSLGQNPYPGQSKFDYKSDTNSLYGVARENNFGQLAVLTLDYQTNSGFHFTSLSAYLRYTMDSFSPSGFAYYNITSYRPIDEGEEQYSEEFRISSPAGKQFEVSAGAFFLDDHWGQFQDVSGYGTFSGGPYNAANLPPPPSAAVALNPAPVSSEFDETMNVQTRDLSAFLSGTFHATSRLSATLSGRYTDEDRGAEFGRIFSIGVPVAASPFAGCLGGVGPTAAYLPSCSTVGGSYLGLHPASVSGQFWDGSATAQYQATSSVLFYGSWSKGSKGAGFANQTGVVGQPYGVETAYTTEVGMKSTFPDVSLLGNVRLNLAVFHTQIDGLQEAVFNGAVFVVSQRNVQSNGVDADFDIAPSPNWTLGTNLTYLQARNRESPDDLDIEAGTPVVGAPDWSGRAFVSYKHVISDRLSLEVTPSVLFRSTVNLRDFTDGPLNCASSPTIFAYSCFFPRSAAFGKIGVRVALNDAAAGWSLAIIGENLNDVHTLSYAYPGAGGFGTQASSEPPRTIALQFSLRH